MFVGGQQGECGRVSEVREEYVVSLVGEWETGEQSG